MQIEHYQDRCVEVIRRECYSNDTRYRREVFDRIVKLKKMDQPVDNLLAICLLDPDGLNRRSFLDECKKQNFISKNVAIKLAENLIVISDKMSNDELRSYIHIFRVSSEAYNHVCFTYLKHHDASIRGWLTRYLQDEVEHSHRSQYDNMIDFLKRSKILSEHEVLVYFSHLERYNAFLILVRLFKTLLNEKERVEAESIVGDLSSIAFF